MMMADANNINSLREDFEEAAEHVKTLPASLDNDQLLKLYARYKQATVGKCNTSKPHMFDLQGRSKWNAWSELGDMKSCDAMTEYVSIINSIDTEWRTKVADKDSEKQSSSFGISVSTLKKPEEELIMDEDKTVFDWCKEGSLQKVKQCITGNERLIHLVDDEGLCLLHWACDRGHEDIVHYLLNQKADIEQQDGDGQTALHYACICEHKDIVETLLRHGADPNANDNDGSTPSENTNHQQILSLLNEKKIVT